MLKFAWHGLVHTSGNSHHGDQPDLHPCPRLRQDLFPTIFDGTLGLYNRLPVALQLEPTIQPICFKVHWVPFTLKPKIDEELNWLIEEGVLELVVMGMGMENTLVMGNAHSHPNQAKQSVCIFTDYMCTLNQALQDYGCSQTAN